MSGFLHLEHEEQNEVLKFKNFLISVADEFKVIFDKCPDCGGTGLYGVNTFKVMKATGEWGEDHSWGGLYCKRCRGVGHINIDDCSIISKCSKCQGKGCVEPYHFTCSKCGGVGYLLWIDNIIGGELHDRNISR